VVCKLWLAEGQIFLQRGETFLKPGCTERCTCMNRTLTCAAASCGTGEICQVSQATKQRECVPSGKCISLSCLEKFSSERFIVGVHLEANEKPELKSYNLPQQHAVFVANF